MLKQFNRFVARNLLPPPVGRILFLRRLRKRTWNLPAQAIAQCENYTVRITDGPNFYMQYKDEFINQIYGFKAQRPDPLIIDGGSNMGMSILYFKKEYPQARIIGFEPDPQIYKLLQENLARNGIQNVTLVNAGLAAEDGALTFQADGSAGGQVGTGNSTTKVKVERLSHYLKEPVDFLKLNIEGQELPVLQEALASGLLRNVREMVLEYHGWPEGEQRLGDILNLLSGQGYRYLVHDFDHEAGGASKPPFELRPQVTWFCLVYAVKVAAAKL